MEAVAADHLRKAKRGAVLPALQAEGEIAVTGQWREDEGIVEAEGADGKHGGKAQGERCKVKGEGSLAVILTPFTLLLRFL
jgi:hypothetical protein